MSASHHTQHPVVVCGHLCLDIAPELFARGSGDDLVPAPGQLNEIGPARISGGGSVANTGLALCRLGIRPHLIGMVGNDLLGTLLREVLRRFQPTPDLDLVASERGSTSYTIVVDPPDRDRSFLHHAGVNHTIRPADILARLPASIRLLHFGYPPIMRETYRDGGAGLEELFSTVQRRGGAVSLDMSMPDPEGEAATVDWHQWLARVLPFVDLFLPGLEEMERMLGISAGGGSLTLERLRGLAGFLLAAGAGVVGLKLGADGIYLRTKDATASFGRIAGTDSANWSDRELVARSVPEAVQNTTGAGDAAIAGLLASVLRGATPETALRAAARSGARSVSTREAIQGIPPWEELMSASDLPGPAATRLQMDGGAWNEAGTLWQADPSRPC